MSRSCHPDLRHTGEAMGPPNSSEPVSVWELGQVFEPLFLCPASCRRFPSLGNQAYLFLSKLNKENSHFVKNNYLTLEGLPDMWLIGSNFATFRIRTPNFLSWIFSLKFKLRDFLFFTMTSCVFPLYHCFNTVYKHSQNIPFPKEISNFYIQLGIFLTCTFLSQNLLHPESQLIGNITEYLSKE